MPEYLANKRVDDLARDLRKCLTQWAIEPPSAPRNLHTGLTHWAEQTMDTAGDLATALGHPNRFLGSGL